MTGKPLKRETTKSLHHYRVGVGVVMGPNPRMNGDCTNLTGDCTRLAGNCTGLRGDCTNLMGNLYEIPDEARPARLDDWVEE